MDERTAGNGFVSIHRSITAHWLWQEKPFSKAQAWIDLIMLADYKDGKFAYKGKIVTAKRGTVYRSFSYLAERWGWTRDKTSRFLHLLEEDNMVALDAGRHLTTIKIINYDHFQTPTNSRSRSENQSATREKRRDTRDSTLIVNKPKPCIEDGSSDPPTSTETAEEIAKAKEWFDSL